MGDVAVFESDVREFNPEAGMSRAALSWSAAIAGAVAATAVSLLVIALGSGIGLSFASPYDGPSLRSLTIAAAVWMVMAQTMGFAAGGYLAARLRTPDHDKPADETAFRDAAGGFMVWALGVIVMLALAGAFALFAAGTAAHVDNDAANGSGTASGQATSTAPTEYFVDLMLRPPPGAVTDGQGASQTVGAASSSARPSLDGEARAEVSRVLARSIGRGGLDSDDRAYLTQLVSARTGLEADEAQRRVAAVESKAREDIKEATDKAATAGAYFAFWTFMSLLFGGVAATLAGLLGGQLRDADRSLAEIT